MVAMQDQNPKIYRRLLDSGQMDWFARGGRVNSFADETALPEYYVMLYERR